MKAYTLKELLELRQVYVNSGSVYALQEVNQEIARLAKKMKVNYYSLG